MLDLLRRSATALILFAAVATAQVDYLPLAEGNTWPYVTATGEHETKLITGQTTVFGQNAWIMEYPGSPWNGVLDQYWAVDANGDVVFHGFWREDWGRAYGPPLVQVDAPLELGQTWSTTVDAYSLPDLVYESTFTIYYEVLEAGTYEVPAGSFDAYGVGTVAPPVVEKDGRRYSVLGELIFPASAPRPTGGVWAWARCSTCTWISCNSSRTRSGRLRCRAGPGAG